MLPFSFYPFVSSFQSFSFDAWKEVVRKKYNHTIFNSIFQPIRSSASLIFAFIQIKFKSTNTPESRTDSSILIFQDLQCTSVTHKVTLLLFSLTCWVILKYILIMLLLSNKWCLERFYRFLFVEQR